MDHTNITNRGLSTDTSEQGMESLIVEAMTGLVYPSSKAEKGTPGGAGWILGHPKAYYRDYALDLVQLRAFLEATQPVLAQALDLAHEGPVRHAFPCPHGEPRHHWQRCARGQKVQGGHLGERPQEPGPLSI
jgi:type I restriction enzyme R subunit